MSRNPSRFQRWSSALTDRSQGGFTLLEVMITLVVVAIGLLGIAGIQALALSNSNSSRTRGMAAMMASSMAASMSANPLYWKAGLLASHIKVTTNPIAVDSSATGSDASLAGVVTSATDCASATCTPLNMAGYDVYQWASSISQLPSGTGEIVCTTAVGSAVTCTITIGWSEKIVGTKQFKGVQNTYNYQTVVQP